MIFYDGPSKIDREPIMGIITGLGRPSANRATGSLVQIYIMPSDIHPVDALKTGADQAVCGPCPLRATFYDGTRYSGRTCYVTPHAIVSIWNAYVRGSYPRVTPHEAADALQDRRVRLGAWGDPAAIPIDIWDTVLAKAHSHVGYTHQWRNRKLRDILRYCQGSVETLDQARQVQALGAGTFRIHKPGDPLADNEIRCPKSIGPTQCDTCMRCDGLSGNNIAIEVHGPTRSNFVQLSL